MPAALADDVDDVKAAVQRYIAALNAGDANAYIQTRMPEYSAFSGGGLLERYHSLEEQKNRFQGLIDSGVKFNLQIRHLEVKVYGDTAIVTGYTVATDNIDQRTEVWIKQGGQWKQAHRHTSPVVLPQ
ncbi:nuclear transport factor 2 family protein [Acidobacteria bacterium AH-259-D05]|nr:nuclear transport factor 2 family protein [Acidobacteria bacterium AH-259-D05]